MSCHDGTSPSGPRPWTTQAGLLFGNNQGLYPGLFPLQQHDTLVGHAPVPVLDIQL